MTDDRGAVAPFEFEVEEVETDGAEEEEGEVGDEPEAGEDADEDLATARALEVRPDEQETEGREGEEDQALEEGRAVPGDVERAEGVVGHGMESSQGARYRSATGAGADSASSHHASLRT